MKSVFSASRALRLVLSRQTLCATHRTLTTASNPRTFQTVQCGPVSRHGVFKTLRKYCTTSSSNDQNSDDSVKGGDSSAGIPLPPAEFDTEMYNEVDEDLTLRLTDEQIQELTKGDEELIKKVRYIQMEHEMMRQEGIMVPTKPIKFSKWPDLLQLKSKSQRRKFYNFLFKLEKTLENEEDKKKKRLEQRREFLDSLPPLPPLGEDPHGMIYGLNRNTLTLRLRQSTEFHFYHNRVMRELMFGEQIVFDCDLLDHMNRREQQNCASQIEACFSVNRLHETPFYMNLCGFQKDSPFGERFISKVPTYEEIDKFPATITEKTFLEMFDRDQLVYLTPDSKNVLKDYDPNVTMIVGALVDREVEKPYTLAKARKQKIRTAKLPLDEYLDWGMGHKALTLVSMMEILLDWRLSNDWNYALRHVPRRKLRYTDDHAEREIGKRSARMNIPANLTRSISRDSDEEAAHRSAAQFERPNRQFQENWDMRQRERDPYRQPGNEFQQRRSDVSEYRRLASRDRSHEPNRRDFELRDKQSNQYNVRSRSRAGMSDD